MREIKFRAWNNGKMYHFDRHYFCDEYDMLSFPMKEDGYLHDGYVLMQFTGLLDKNGKQIYEGDIINNWAICYYEGIFAPYYDYGRQERYEDIGSDWWSKSEVIGNIYENPELLSK